MKYQLLLSLGTVALLFVFCFAAKVFSGFPPPCLFHHLTGLRCPGCGGTRATLALLDGNLPAAFGLNPLVVVLPFLPFLIPALPVKLRLLLPLIALLLFGIGRNLG